VFAPNNEFEGEWVNEFEKNVEEEVRLIVIRNEDVKVERFEGKICEWFDEYDRYKIIF